jgi:hypothetical protein
VYIYISWAILDGHGDHNRVRREMTLTISLVHLSSLSHTQARKRRREKGLKLGSSKRWP